MLPMRKKRIGVIILFIFLYLGSNTAEEGGADGEETPKVSPAPPAASASEEETQEPFLLNPVKPPNEDVDPATEAVPEKEEPEKIENLPLEIRKKLSYQRLSPPILPEDFKIGPLGGGPEQEPVLNPVRQLLKGLSEGTTDETLLVSELRPSLMRILEDFPPGDLTYRLGKVHFLDEGYSSVNCRIYRPIEGDEQAVASGELHLEYFEGAWLIAAVDIDFQDLVRPYLRDTASFEPQTYRWLELY